MAQIVVTGANRGIGLALVREYARRGDDVLALCRSPDDAADLHEIRKTTSNRVQLGAIDIGEAESIEKAAKLSKGPVDVLINNAGTSGGLHQSLDDIEYEAWMDAFRVMAIGPFRVVKAFLPALEKAKGAKVMSVSSALSSSVWPHGGRYIYASAKAAGNRIMQILARDLRHKGISVAYIHPGWVQTEMGGPNAEIPPAESAKGISNVIDRLGLEDSGKFFKWTGEIHAF